MTERPKMSEPFDVDDESPAQQSKGGRAPKGEAGRLVSFLHAISEGKLEDRLDVTSFADRGSGRWPSRPTRQPAGPRPTSGTLASGCSS